MVITLALTLPLVNFDYQHVFKYIQYIYRVIIYVIIAYHTAISVSNYLIETTYNQ